VTKILWIALLIAPGDHSPFDGVVVADGYDAQVRLCGNVLDDSFGRHQAI